MPMAAAPDSSPDKIIALVRFMVSLPFAHAPTVLRQRQGSYAFSGQRCHELFDSRFFL
jgi:hypothetical protein